MLDFRKSCVGLGNHVWVSEIMPDAQKLWVILEKSSLILRNHACSTSEIVRVSQEICKN